MDRAQTDRSLALVTGASGFIGSHLVQRLAADGIPVRCVEHRGPVACHPGNVTIFQADLADAAAARAAINGVGVVFHLAGSASVRSSHSSPDETFRANTLATQNVLEAARVAQVRAVVMVSTAHIYGAPRTLPVAESHPPAPASVYAATKLAADMLALGYYRSFGLPVTILRPFNVYGPHQGTAAVIPKIVEQVLSGVPVRVDKLHPRRDFVYVDDVVDAMILAMETPAAVGREILLASGRPVSVAELVRKIERLVYGGSGDLPRDVPEQSLPEQLLKDVPPESDDCIYGDPSGARAALGWEARIDLATGLARTIAWWRHRILTREGASIGQL